MKQIAFRRICLRLVFVMAAVGVGLVGLRFCVVMYERTQYPYGWSHCCLKCLGLALENYAMKYHGHFPTGGKYPEASLSLLYKNGELDPETLRGKTIPVELVESILERGELLGPDSCGWHYVEGITKSDTPELAVVWDKVGLDHNGRDLKGGHSVWFLRGEERIVPASEWPQFLKEQEKLMAARTKKAKNGGERSSDSE